MCTRFYLDNTLQLENYAEQAKKSSLGRQMAIRLPLNLTRLSGEIRPEMTAPVIASNRNFEQTVFPMLWGYHLGDKAPLLVNARTETAKVKPTFMDSWMAHRCAIPCSWYYEWEHVQQANGKKAAGTKYRLQPRDRMVTWLCGLYRMEGQFPHFVVLTQNAAEDIAFIHDRMPLMLPEDAVEDWINPKNSNPSNLLPMALTKMEYSIDEGRNEESTLD